MKPKISVIIPIGPGRKMEALAHLRNQTLKTEVIVEQGNNPSANRNRGIARAKGDIMVFINGHSIPPADWAEKIVAFFSRYPKIDMVGGPQLTPKKESYIGRVSGYALTSRFGAAEARTRYKQTKMSMHADEKMLTSANLACRRSVVKKIKFDEALWPGEDPKFIAEAKKAGFAIAYAPEIFVYHRRRATIADFAKQIFNYGYTRPKKESFWQTMKNPSFLIPGLFVLYLALFSLFSLVDVLFLIPLILYTLLLVCFSAYASIVNNDLSAMIILPFIFFVIHLVYGLGFIAGTIAKYNGTN